MSRVETIIIPTRNLLCAGDALGAELPIQLSNGETGVLALPIKNDEPLNEKGGGSLRQHPSGSIPLTMLYWRKEATWGTFYERDGTSFAHVESFSVWFNTDAASAQTIGNSIWTEFKKWYRRFIEFIEAISGRIQENIPDLGPHVDDFQLWLTSPDAKPENLASPPKMFHYRVAGPDDYIQHSVLQQAAALANTQRVLRTEYRLLIQAGRNLQAGNLRVAVLDAATAVEMVLIAQIDQQLAPLNLSIVNQEKIKRKLASGLMSLIGVLKLFGVIVPGKAHKENLADVRDASIHAGVDPAQEKASAALVLARQIVQYFSPDYI